MVSVVDDPGIRLEELHTLRYQCAVKKEGRRIFNIVFSWSYSGGHLSVRDYLFQDPEFTNNRFRKLFNLSQRTKLTSSDPISSYDITLLYVILRQVCDLDKNDEVWISENNANPTLENLLFKVKKHRNVLAHEELTMSEQDMNSKLDELQQLFGDLILLAGTQFSIPEAEISHIVKTTEKNINLLKCKIREPLGPTDVAELQQEFKEIQEQVKSNIQELSKVEVKRLYMILCVLDPVPWLLMNLKVQLSELFTHFYMKKENISAQSEGEQQLSIYCDDLLQVKLNGVLPGILILTGEGGMGKSTYLKHLTEMWIKDPSTILCLNDIELLLYIECRHPSISTVDGLLKHMLHDTCQKINVEFGHLREAVLHMQLLFLIDGFDEVNHASRQLIQEIVNLPGENIRIIITTRPGHTNQLLKLIPCTKGKVTFTIEGITRDHHLDIVERLCRNLVTEEKFLSLKLLLEKHMCFMAEQLGTHMNNPLILTLVALFFLQDPNRTDSLSTATQIYRELRNLLTEKLTERLSLNKYEPDLEYKCLQFLKYSDELSLKAMQCQEYDLQKETVERLKTRCRELALPPEEVLSAYFTVRRSKNGLHYVIKYTYYHLRLQEFSAACHVHDRITSSVDLTKTVQQFMSEAKHWKSEMRFQSVLIHLTGLLAEGYDDILGRHADDIFSLLYLETTNVDFILAHVVESKYNPRIIEAAAKKLEDHLLKWNGWLDIKSRNHFGAISPVLNMVHFHPERVTLTIYSLTDLCLHSENVVSTLSQKVSELVLDMPNHYRKVTDANADDFIINLARPGAFCKFVAFRGTLSPAAMQVLPSCITELRLRISHNVLHSLNERLVKLQQLAILGLKYQDTIRTSSEQVPAVVYHGKTFCLCFDPPISDAEEDVVWACSVLAKMCSLRSQGICTSIVFSTTQLTFPGCERLLNHLHENGVRIERRIDVFSYSRIERENRKQLQKLSQSLNLGTLSWHNL